MKKQAKVGKEAKTEDEIMTENDAEENKEGGDMEKKEDDQNVDYKVEGRQSSLNGADISSDIFGGGDDLILPGR